MSCTATIARHARHLVGIAVASMMLAAQPAVALAATPTTEDPALVAFYDEDEIKDITNASVKLESSYPYTGGPIEPKPIVYISLRDAYNIGILGEDFSRNDYERYLDEIDAKKYYYDHYYGTAEYDEHFYTEDDELDLNDVFEILEYLTDKSKFFTYYNITEDYFDWIRRPEVILDPVTNKGYVYRLTEEKEYTLSYEDNVNPGDGTIYIRGEDPFRNEIKYYFTIGVASAEGYDRIAGPTRYDTMAEIVARSFTRPTTYAVIATGQNFPDALAASSLAGTYSAPVILTETNALSAQARTQLTNLGITDVFLMGGTSAVSQAVETELAEMKINVTRIAGDGRVGTSLRAMEQTYVGGSTSETVIIATCNQFADSLSIGPWAYASKSPIILTNQDGVLSDDALKAIKDHTSITRVIIVGGTDAVSDNVRTQLGNYYTIERIAGADRYETSARIAEWVTSSKNFLWNAPLVATGANYPDALAGAPLAGKTSQVILLVSNKDDAAVKTMTSHKDKITTFFVLGGEGAVSKTLADDIAASLK